MMRLFIDTAENGGRRHVPQKRAKISHSSPSGLNPNVAATLPHFSAWSPHINGSSAWWHFRSADRPSGSAPKQNGDDKLAPREWQIIELAAQGYSPKEVAYKLGASYQMVKAQCRSFYEKLRVHNLNQAIL